ncbi:MAG: alpha-glucosidase C-terminal domain-containing protein [bacterium]|nr:MAG: alpha-glucosidase C-terminal domain-containing protein [bacterium]
MKKYFLLFHFLILAICCKNTPERPIEFQDPWFFQIDREKVGIRQEWFRMDYDLSALKKAEIADDWESLTGSDYDGWGWYFIDFSFHDQFEKAALSFLSVDDNAIVWLNDQMVGKHYGANESFKMDVSRLLKSGINRLVVRIEDTGGFGGLNGAVELIPFKQEEDLLKGKYFGAKTPVHPYWASNAVIYELNTRQFTREGTFKAIEPRIKELRDLGVNIIWFMPIHPIGEKNRKGSLGSYYSVKDYYGINPEFGDLNDFKRLIQLMHEADMYAIIDLVANHTAWDNPLIEQHPEWYTHDNDGNIISPISDWYDVADLNYNNPDLRRYMIDVMKYWIAEVGIDGFRCDVAAMVPTDFWIEARKALDTIKPVFMLAEAETPELNAYGFDMTYASAMHRLFNEIAQGKRSPKEIDLFLKFEYYNYPPGSMRMRFTSNHDENSWNQSVIIRMGREAARVGAVLTCTLPGNPLIYNGQEVGNEKALNFFERDPIAWQENEFRSFYQELFWTYRQHPALNLGDMKKLVSNNDDQIYSFIRRYKDDKVVVVVNFSADSFKGEIHFNGIKGLFIEIFSDIELFFNEGKMFVNMKPWEYRIYVEKK